MGEALKDVEGVNGGESMSGTPWLISLITLGQGSIEGGTSGVNMEEPQLEVGGRDQALDMEGLQKMLVVERVRVENIEHEVAFF